MTGRARIHQLLIGTLQVMGPAQTINAPAGPRHRQPDSLRNHVPAPGARSGRPKMLGHDGFPAGLSNGKKPEHPAR